MALEIPEIKNFEDFLQPIIKNGSEIVTWKTKLLTAFGENYGSLLLSVEVTIKNDKNKETLNMVAKLCPLNEWLKRMFASKITFKKEIGFYMDIVPSLINFQKDHNVSEDHLLAIFPKCLNSRISLDPNSNEVDDDAILLLENLRFNGFKSLDRLVGFNLQETELVLKDLARFHAVPLAFKIKKPNEFKNKIMPLLNRVCIGQEMFNTAENRSRFNECIYRHLNLNEKELQRFVDGMSVGYNFQRNFPSGNEKYATIVHCDFWLNNTMIKSENNTPVKNKMIDFQVATYGAPATDVVFFLYTSTQLEILDKYYEHCLKVYHKTFVDCLKELHCDTTDYTFDSFLNEVNYYGAREASHILIMFRAVFRVTTEKKPSNDMNFDDMFTDDGITDIFKNRLKFTVKKFFENNWF